MSTTDRPKRYDVDEDAVDQYAHEDEACMYEGPLPDDAEEEDEGAPQPHPGLCACRYCAPDDWRDVG